MFHVKHPLFLGIRIFTSMNSPWSFSINLAFGSSTLVQPKTKFFNLATYWKMGFFYEIFCQI